MVALILFSYDLQFSVELGSCINQYDVIWFSVLSLVFHPIKKKKFPIKKSLVFHQSVILHFGTINIDIYKSERKIWEMLDCISFQCK